MLSAQDISGLMAMMPAFATDDAGDYRARSTIDVGRLHAGVDRMIRDGANVISTTGSFGECHTLMMDEFRTLAHETAAVNKQRVPLFAGVTSTHTREVYEKCKLLEGAKIDGVLVGVPYYFPSSIENAMRFYKDIGEAFPHLNIMIYHNPPLHNVKLTLSVMQEIMKIPNVVAMKDSHREPVEFMRLAQMAKGRMTVVVNQLQYAMFHQTGARAFWSIDSWYGPWPLLALRDAVAQGDTARATEITLDIAPPVGAKPKSLSWRETASKIGIRYAGYVDPGPLRSPFVEIPADVDAEQKAKAIKWKALCEKYRKDVAVPV